jgi:WD40 repeat protein
MRRMIYRLVWLAAFFSATLLTASAVLAQSSNDVCITKTLYHGEDLVFSPDSKYLVASWDEEVGSARLWDVETGKVIQTLSDSKDSLGRFAFSSDGNYLLTGTYNSLTFISLWDIRTGEKLYQIAPDEGLYGESAPSISISQDDEYIFVKSDFGLRIYSSATGKLLNSFVPPLSSKVALAWNSAFILTQIINVDGTENIELWNLRANKKLQSLEFGSHVVNAFFASGEQYIGVTSNITRDEKPKYKYALWDTFTYREIYSIVVDDFIEMMASEDGRYLLVLNDSGEVLWDVEKEQPLHTFTDLVLSPNFLPDSRHLLIGVNGPNHQPIYHLWDINQNDERPNFSIEYDSRTVTSAISSNSKYLAVSTDDGRLRLWNLTTGKEMHLDC